MVYIYIYIYVQGAFSWLRNWILGWLWWVCRGWSCSACWACRGWSCWACWGSTWWSLQRSQRFQVSIRPWSQLAVLWLCHSGLLPSMLYSEVGSLNVCYHRCYVLLGRCSYGRRNQRSHGSCRTFGPGWLLLLGRMPAFLELIARCKEQSDLGKLGLEGCSITWRI